MEEVEISCEVQKILLAEARKSGKMGNGKLCPGLALLVALSFFSLTVAPLSAAKQYPLGARDNQVGNPSVDSGRREARPERSERVPGNNAYRRKA